MRANACHSLSCIPLAKESTPLQGGEDLSSEFHNDLYTINFGRRRWFAAELRPPADAKGKKAGIAGEGQCDGLERLGEMWRRYSGLDVPDSVWFAATTDILRHLLGPMPAVLGRCGGGEDAAAAAAADGAAASTSAASAPAKSAPAPPCVSQEQAGKLGAMTSDKNSALYRAAVKIQARWGLARRWGPA